MKNISVIYPLVDYKVWAKRYGLVPDERPCPSCGQVFITDIPFAHGGWRCLQTKPHACGPRTMVSVGKHFDENGQVMYQNWAF